MAKSAIPPDSREWPDHEHREYPKHLGFDEAGVDIIVADENEEIKRLDDVVYPKLLGKDKNGKPVFANHPDQEGWKGKLVVAEPEPVKVEAPKSVLVPAQGATNGAAGSGGGVGAAGSGQS